MVTFHPATLLPSPASPVNRNGKRSTGRRGSESSASGCDDDSPESLCLTRLSSFWLTEGAVGTAHHCALGVGRGTLQAGAPAREGPPTGTSRGGCQGAGAAGVPQASFSAQLLRVVSLARWLQGSTITWAGATGLRGGLLLPAIRDKAGGRKSSLCKMPALREGSGPPCQRGPSPVPAEGCWGPVCWRADAGAGWAGGRRARGPEVPSRGFVSCERVPSWAQPVASGARWPEDQESLRREKAESEVIQGRRISKAGANATTGFWGSVTPKWQCPLSQLSFGTPTAPFCHVLLVGGRVRPHLFTGGLSGHLQPRSKPPRRAPWPRSSALALDAFLKSSCARIASSMVRTQPCRLGTVVRGRLDVPGLPAFSVSAAGWWLLYTPSPPNESARTVFSCQSHGCLRADHAPFCPPVRKNVHPELCFRDHSPRGLRHRGGGGDPGPRARS